jgi:predicted transcriptional regulator
MVGGYVWAGPADKLTGQEEWNMADDTLITLTADIVSAHVSNNEVAPADLPRLIQSVFHALSNVGMPVPIVEEAREPAVTIRSSVKPGAIVCLECGAKFKMLKRHLMADHNLTPADYKARWNLKSDYPLVAPEYAALRAELAKTIGLGRKPGTVRKGGRPKKVPAA